MKLKELLTDDDAVSPVIGVILMVAITVILAAVIATFVLGLGEQVSNTAPNANFQFDYDNSSDNQNVTVTHTSGPTIEKTSLSLGGAGIEESIGFDELNSSYNNLDEDVSAGDTAKIVGNSDGGVPADRNLTSGKQISVIWESDDGESATLANYEVPDN